MTTGQRDAALRACAALYGLALAISLHDRFLRPASAGQLPGLMSSLGLDAHASFRFMAAVVVLPVLFALASRRLTAVLAISERWAQVTFASACLGALWVVTLYRDPPWVTLPAAAVMAVVVTLRRFPARFTRRDVILIPTAAALFLAITDMTSLGLERTVVISAVATLALRLIVAAIPRPLEPAIAFALAPLALVAQTHFLGRNERYLGWPAMAIVVVTAVVLRLVVKRPRRLRLALAWFIYPLACYSYLSATSLYSAEGKPRVNVFEDAQHLVPAAEMARGEKLYRDIIAPHGLIQDGLLDRPFITPHGGNIGQVLKGRGTISGLIACAQYALGVAATGSVEGGVIAFFVGALLGIGGGTFRAVPALLTLAVILHAVRRRRPRLLAYAGAGVVLAALTSLDFGFYVGVALLVACFLLKHFRHAILGGLAATTVAAIALAIAGILPDFIRTTFIEIPGWGQVYALTPFGAPPALKANHFIPDVLALILDRSTWLYLLWAGALIFFAVTIAARRRSRRVDVMTVFCAFVIVCAVSYAERHHLHFQYGVPSMLAGILFALPTFRMRLAATVLVLILAQPTTHLGIVSWLRHTHGPVDATVREISDPPRARGALYTHADAEMIAAAQAYVVRHLNPEETFVDFTNRGFLYYLVDRDCPLRQIEVAFYEPQARQRQVIDAIERNPRIRAALVPPPDGDDTGVDGIPNPARAPLVWRYLQDHFEPHYREGKVVFWRRK